MRFSFVIILSGCMLLLAQAYPENSPSVSKECQNKLDKVDSLCSFHIYMLAPLACALLKDGRFHNASDAERIRRYNVAVNKSWSESFLETNECCHRPCTIPDMMKDC